MKPKYDIFISYSREDERLITPLFQLLCVGGKRVFRDVNEIAPGDVWSQRIEDALDGAKVFIFFWCCHAAKSEWVSREISREIKNRKARIIPAVLCNTPLPENVRQFQWVDFTDILDHCRHAGAEFHISEKTRIDPLKTIENTHGVDAGGSGLFDAYEKVMRHTSAKAERESTPFKFRGIVRPGLRLISIVILPLSLLLIAQKLGMTGPGLHFVTASAGLLVVLLLLLAHLSRYAFRREVKIQKLEPELDFPPEPLTPGLNREGVTVSLALYGLLSQDENRRD